MKHLFTTFIGCIVFFYSCHNEIIHEPDKDVSQTKVENNLETLVPISRLPLYADLSKYNMVRDSPLTKSDFGRVSLISLLDMSQVITYDNITAIPFLQNNDNVLACIDYAEEPDFSQATVVKKYYVERQSQGVSQYYIATMINDKTYFDNHPEFDFVHKPNYTGLCIFSNLDGTIKNVRVYKNGRVLPAKIVEANYKTQDREGDGMVALYLDAPNTKSDNTITPSYCIAFRYIWLNPSFCNGFYGQTNPSGSAGASSGGNEGGPDLSWDGDGETAEEEITYTVDLTTNCPNEISIGGSGIYTMGSMVAIYYSFKDYIEYVEFSHWTGDFSEKTEAEFLFTVEDDITATAYFDVSKPCSDETRGITNPLIKMLVAACGPSGNNYKGGTYGKTRRNTDGSRKNHDGLDLLASIGTPVYSMYQGIITCAISEIPDDYIKKSFGNKIEITSTLSNGSKVTVLYAHLQSGNAIAINPRTGIQYQVGDLVYRGDLIGYTGRSGNAFKDNEVPNKHLHLGVKISGKNVDPVDYINGTIDTNTINRTKGIIDNIKCD